MINPMIATYMVANGTKVIHSRSCNLGSVIINNAGASANTLTLYNGTSATGYSDVIAIIDTVELNGRMLVYNIACPKGLTAVMATGTAADITITSEGPEV